MASPWGKIATIAQPADLQEIMSEEFARELQKKENRKISKVGRFNFYIYNY